LPTYNFVLMETLLHPEDANQSDGRPRRNARRQNAGESRNSDLMREVGKRSCQKGK
jgi:hypothetical protein